jgi:hypothetical protein
MPRSSFVVLSVLALGAVWVPPAAGQGGNGLYEPFPQPRAASRAQAYAARLGVSATKRDLRRGVFVGNSLRRGAGEPPAASDRAGLHVSTAGLGALLLAVLGATAALISVRRRPASVRRRPTPSPAT